MFHVNPRAPKTNKLDYSKLLAESEEKERLQSLTPNVPDDDSIPEAPPGFSFYRIQSGDTLVSLAIKFNVSQTRLRRYNRELCFGHRLGHISGKLLLVPMVSNVKITPEIQEQLEQLMLSDESKQNLTEKEYTEPDENGKYQLRKALMYHAKGLDENRANYYLGEANWNVRKALTLFKEDDKWEKRNRVLKACVGINQSEATQLLATYNGDVSAAIQHWHKAKKKEEKENARIVKSLQKRKKNNNDETTPTGDENEIEMQTETNKNTRNDDDEDDENFDQFSKCC